MAGAGRSRRRARGGDGIQATRQARARLTLAAGALLVAAGLAAYAALTADRLGWLLASLGAAAGLALVAGLASQRPALVTGGLVILGGEYAGFFLVRGGSIDERAPLYAAGFLVAAELAFGGLERRSVATPEIVLRRVAALTVLAVAAVALGAAVLAVAALPAGGGVALHAVGVAAAIAAVLLVGLAALRSS